MVVEEFLEVLLIEVWEFFLGFIGEVICIEGLFDLLCFLCDFVLFNCFCIIINVIDYWFVLCLWFNFYLCVKLVYFIVFCYFIFDGWVDVFVEVNVYGIWNFKFSELVFVSVFVEVLLFFEVFNYVLSLICDCNSVVYL